MQYFVNCVARPAESAELREAENPRDMRRHFLWVDIRTTLSTGYLIRQVTQYFKYD